MLGHKALRTPAHAGCTHAYTRACKHAQVCRHTCTSRNTSFLAPPRPTAQVFGVLLTRVGLSLFVSKLDLLRQDPAFVAAASSTSLPRWECGSVGCACMLARVFVWRWALLSGPFNDGKIKRTRHRECVQLRSQSYQQQVVVAVP